MYNVFKIVGFLDPFPSPYKSLKYLLFDSKLGVFHYLYLTPSGRTSYMEVPLLSLLSLPSFSPSFPLLTIAVFKHRHKSQGTPNKPYFLFLPRVSMCDCRVVSYQMAFALSLVNTTIQNGGNGHASVYEHYGFSIV